ncbi:MAG: hypothetical protein J0L55_01025 [Caulobacterales bacterium]|nr:hypothetical protein [Caulobacterales bacterium]MCA0373715.1 hypothetical protein [Pseudomonadota bacterium]
MNNIGPNLFPNNARPTNTNNGREIFLKALEQARAAKPATQQTEVQTSAAPQNINNIKIPDEAPTTNIRKGMVLDIRV